MEFTEIPAEGSTIKINNTIFEFVNNPDITNGYAIGNGSTNIAVNISEANSVRDVIEQFLQMGAKMSHSVHILTYLPADSKANVPFL